MDYRHWSYVNFPPKGYEDVVGEPRSIKLAKFTKVKACASYWLPRSRTEFFQLPKELLADRPGLESGLPPKPSDGGKCVTFKGEVTAWLKVLD